MNRFIFIGLTLVLFSCQSSQDFKQKYFGDNNWKNHNSSTMGFYDNLRFGDDDTLTLDQPSFGHVNDRFWFKFDSQGKGFYIVQEQPVYYFKILSASTNQVSLQNNQYTLDLTRQ